MKIRSIKNTIHSLTEEELKKYVVPDGKYFIKLGKEYVVYALCTYKGYTWYCISDDVSLFYPSWYPFLFFTVTDNRLSRFWVCGQEEDNHKTVPFLSFPEWVNNPYFYGELVEGSGNGSNAVLFKRYKKQMDLEFPDSSISDTAQMGDVEWLICPECLAAWKWLSDKDALVQCTKCQTILNNPRYK